MYAVLCVLSHNNQNARTVAVKLVASFSLFITSTSICGRTIACIWWYSAQIPNEMVKEWEFERCYFKWHLKLSWTWFWTYVSIVWRHANNVYTTINDNIAAIRKKANNQFNCRYKNIERNCIYVSASLQAASLIVCVCVIKREKLLITGYMNCNWPRIGNRHR